ncbi:hypothetical protein BJ912DRAFT_1002362 [Pholiota molesta]|nr:hypothetical protein BJ912DRAFT_1002362 [Pholiota molesta]
MSDSFADLWSASAPAKPKPQTLSSALSSSSTTNRSTTASKPDVFALLAGSGSTPGSGTSTPRYGTGLGAPAIGGSRPITPSLSTLSTVPATTNTINRQTTPQPPPQSIAKTGSRGAADAFGDLFAPSSTAAGSGNMTLAARLAMEAQRKGSQQLGRGAAPKTQGVVIDDVDDWGLSDFGSSAAATVGAAGRAAGSANSAAERSKPKAATNLWDLDDFAASTTPASGSTSGAKNGAVHSQSISTAGRNGSRTAHKERVTSPDDEFDFGGREDRVDEARWAHKGHTTGTDKLLDLFEDDHDVTSGPQSSRGLLDSESRGYDEDEDDVLGMLNKPIAAPKTRYTASPEPSRHRPSPPGSAPRAPSPPPHVLGQIVEMGFSVQQARAALAQTATGLDVPAAIERLLNHTTSSPAPPPTHPTPPARGGAPRSETPPPARSRGVPKGQKERERERLERQRTAAAGAGAGEGASSTPSVADLQEHADKLLAQASEIGLSVFSKASAMWGKGREKVVKAYEERAGGAPDAAGPRAGARATQEGAGRVVDGRPKWMQEAVGEEFAETPQRGGFRDDDDGEGDVVFDDGGSFPAEQTLPAQAGKAAHHEEEVDLFSDAPANTRTHTQSSAPQPRPGPPHGRPTPGRQQSASSSRSTPAPIPPPPERTLPTASPAALAAALQHKTTGTAQFKLGQHAAAADAYTAGLRALPAGHLLRVPLYTNRALARIRCGEYQPAEDDCARALGVVLGDPAADSEDDALGLDPHAAAAPTTEGKSVVWTPAALPPSLVPSATQTAKTAWAHPQGRGVDLADGYVKALRRRAEAREGREKWAAAARDWEVLAGCAWAPEGVRRDAMRGRSRCKGMMTDDATAAASANGATTTTATAASSRPKPAPAAAKPKPRPPPAPSVPAAPSQALRALQSQNAQAEADESLKDSLKDAVDARLAGWRQGREGNIRALLVGLDVVLWDTALEGVRVRGLHELLSPAQVKKGYVRVIARVHPDKLNSSNTTVEQRMLANGVFGTLNEAWIAFQATQK